MTPAQQEVVDALHVAVGLLNCRPLTSFIVEYADALLAAAGAAVGGEPLVWPEAQQGAAMAHCTTFAAWLRAGRPLEGVEATIVAPPAVEHPTERLSPPPDPSPEVAAELDEQRLVRDFQQGLDGLARMLAAAKRLGIKVELTFST